MLEITHGGFLAMFFVHPAELPFWSFAVLGDGKALVPRPLTKFYTLFFGRRGVLGCGVIFSVLSLRVFVTGITGSDGNLSLWRDSFPILCIIKTRSIARIQKTDGFTALLAPGLFEFLAWSVAAGC